MACSVSDTRTALLFSLAYLKPLAQRQYFMLILILIGALVLSLAVSLILIPPIRGIAFRMGWMDHPDGHRKVHIKEIPRVGGLAIIVAMAVGLGVIALLRPVLPGGLAPAFEMPSALIILGALLMAGVGFVDDVRDMHALPKLIAQTVISLLVVVGGFRITVFDGVLGGGDVALGVSVVLTLIWVVGTVNGVNFIDGMDGLAGGVVAIALVGLGIAHAIGGDISGIVLVAVAVGAVLGFLHYNVRPASIFMGDVGSHFLGYVLAVFALGITTHGNPIVALTIAAVALGLPILDAVVTLVRRPQYNKPLLHSDGDHFHHRLMVRFPNAKVVRILYLVSVFFATGAVLMTLSSIQGALIILLLGVGAVFGFLYWLGYLPGRYANGPADGYGSTRSLHSIVVDAARFPGGDGAMQPVDMTVANKSEVSPSSRVVGGHKKTLTSAARPDQ